MPRLYTSANDARDYCRRHYPTEAGALQVWGSVGDGPDQRGNCFGYDAEHPDYEHDDYHCVRCGKRLAAADN